MSPAVKTLECLEIASSTGVERLPCQLLKVRHLNGWGWQSSERRPQIFFEPGALGILGAEGKDPGLGEWIGGVVRRATGEEWGFIPQG